MQKICIIIPCYNESQRLSIDEFRNFVNKTDNIYFSFVNDGSKDNTFDILNSMRKGYEDRIKIINFKKNSGKAEAVRVGMIESSNWLNFDFLGFFDADLSTPLSEIYNLYENINKNENYIIAFGSRIKIVSNAIERKNYRHYFGRIFATFASIMLNLGIYDTQCGAKLIKNSIVSEIFSKSFYSKWFFDIEIFYRVIKLYGRRESTKKIIEVPLNIWIEKGHSKITLIDWIKVPYELIKLFFRYY